MACSQAAHVTLGLSIMPSLSSKNISEERLIVAFLIAYVPDFIEPENCPPNSPDLNPVDYLIWGVLQQLVYRQRIRDSDHLKEVLTAC